MSAKTAKKYTPRSMAEEMIASKGFAAARESAYRVAAFGNPFYVLVMEEMKGMK